MILMSSALTVFLSIIAFVFILGLIIVIHELGHFVFAKRAKILCHEYSIGMGPALYTHRFGETLFAIRAIPIGGFVAMAGEEMSNDIVKKDSIISLNFKNGTVNEIILDKNIPGTVSGVVIDTDLYGKDGNDLYISLLNSDSTTTTHIVARNAFYIFNSKKSQQIAPYDRCFESKTLLERFLTIVAGPAMNLILAMIICLLYFMFSGVPNYDSTVIGSVSEGYAGYNLLEVNDEIKSINGNSVSSWNEFSSLIDQYTDTNTTDLDIVVLRDGAEYSFTIPATVIINSIGLTNFNVNLSDNAILYPGIVVGEVSPNYSSEISDSEIKIKNGDILTALKIVSYGDLVENSSWIEVTSWSQVMELFSNEDVASVYFKFYSFENEYLLCESTVSAETYGNETLSALDIDKIGIKLGIACETHFSFIGSIKYGASKFWDDFTYIFQTLKILIAPSGVRQIGVSDLSGVVGIFQLVKNYMTSGFLPLFGFIALLSVNIGVINLLPIPALDGGRIVFLFVELVSRKKAPKKIENLVNNIFFILLLAFMVYITFNDIMRFF